MSKTCLVCNTIHLEMIGILRHPKKLDAMLDSLLGLQAQQDDCICNKCCNEVINAFESKQKSDQCGFFESKVLESDGAVIKYEVDQDDQSKTAAFSDMLDVKIEPKSEGIEDVEDVNDWSTDINYEKVMMPGLESKVKQERAIEEYGSTVQRSVMVIGGKREINSTWLNKTISSSTLSEEDLNIATLDSGCKKIGSGEHSKRHCSVDMYDSTVERKPNEERKDIRDISTRTRNRSDHVEIPNSHTGNQPTDKKPYVCCESEKSVNTLSKLEIHETIRTGSTYKCRQCEKDFMSLDKLKVHEKIHTGQKPYKCRDCEKCYTASSKLKIHARKHSGETPYKCRQCEKSFISSYQLTSHERVHTGEKPFKCHECEKCFTTSSKLKLHERTHTGEKPYKCRQCGKCFVSSYHLKSHERIHTGEKPYKCHECEKCFTTSSKLRLHEMAHTGEKPYKCCQCEKSFISSYQLTSHEMIHTGEKPYKCHVCEKCFTTFSKLKIHERNHTGEKPYKCCQCVKSFISSYQLKKHEKIHTGKKPYTCGQCVKSFTTSYYLKIHDRKIHTRKTLQVP